MKLNILRKTKLKLIAFILSNKSYGGIEYTVNKIPNIIDDFFISEDSKDEHILEIVKKNNYKLIYNNKLSGYGSNVKNSLRYAFNKLNADYAIEIHGDHAQFDPSATYDAIKYLNDNYDFISGSRFLKFGLGLQGAFSCFSILAISTSETRLVNSASVYLERVK